MNILEVSHIKKTFPPPPLALGKMPPVIALDDVSFTIEDGESLLIAGECGSGKSVLMRIIAGLVKADSGKVKIVHHGKICKAALIFQDADTQILGDAPLEDVMFSLRHFSPSDRRNEAVKYLQSVGLEDKALYNSRTLSGGEKRSLAVASALALERPLIIFDEPYSNLDYPSILRLNTLIKCLIKDGKSVIILTHETEKALPLCRRMIILSRGKIVFDGNTTDRPRYEAIEKWGIKESASPWL